MLDGGKLLNGRPGPAKQTKARPAEKPGRKRRRVEADLQPEGEAAEKQQESCCR